MESDNKKIVNIVLAVSCLLGAYLVNRGLAYLATTFNVGNSNVLGGIPLTVVISGGLMVGLFVYFSRNATSQNFLSEVLGELKKVVWPTRKETSLSTMVVIVLVCITAVFLWMVDLFWSWVLQRII